MRKTLQQTLLAFALAAFAAAPSAGSAQTPSSAKADVMAAIRQFVVGFNRGDTKMLVAACAGETSILDEFPPHEWHGAGACAAWLADYDADAKKNAITEGVVTLHEPWHIDVTGERAYVVMPANYTYKRKGKPVKEVGSILTLVLVRGATGWQLTGWTWAKR